MKKRTLTLLGVVGLGLLAACVVVIYWVILHRPPRAAPPWDPRLAYAGPFQNVHPEAAYTSEARCAVCHQQISASFATHPMGRSLRPAADGPLPPEDEAHHNPFDALGSRFLVERVGATLKQRRVQLGTDGRPAAELEWDVGYVLGAGKRGQAFLSNRDGYVFQTPVSWDAKGQRWDLAAGFGPTGLTGRAVEPECLYCHANRAIPVPGSVNHYNTTVFEGHAIGCQRCHGPGALHVTRQERSAKHAGEFDATIVNPRHLEPALRDAVCEQCHLPSAGRVLHRGRRLYEFRPAMPLDVFWSVFVPAAGADVKRKAVSQVEQMHESQCFQRSAGPGQLGCVSCHDPHAPVPAEERVAFYRGRCLHCHQEDGAAARRANGKACSLPRTERLKRVREDSCIACHMPRRAGPDAPHTVAFDHRMPRVPGTKESRNGEHMSASEFPIVSYFRQGQELTTEDERDRAVLLVRLTLQGDAAAAAVLSRAIAALEIAIWRDPEDLPAGEALGQGLQAQDRNAEALAAYKVVLAKAPQREESLAGAGAAAAALGHAEEALGYWRRAAALNPWMTETRRRLALLLLQREAWIEAESECAAWVRLDPFSAEGRAAQVACLLALGKSAEAEAERARLEALAPANLPELRSRIETRFRDNH